MYLMSQEESAVFARLDPSTARRLIVSRTGRAFVWDPINRTEEVSPEAARSLVAAGVVGTDGRIAARHLALWNQGRSATPEAQPVPAAARRRPVPPAPVAVLLERTQPLALGDQVLRAL